MGISMQYLRYAINMVHFFIRLGVSGFSSFCVYLFLQEEEALIAAHRKEIEDTMEIVREVSKLALDQW